MYVNIFFIGFGDIIAYVNYIINGKRMLRKKSFQIILIIEFILGLFLYFVLNPKQEDYFLFFNIRRFLIQPLMLLLLLPAFYYHKLKK